MTVFEATVRDGVCRLVRDGARWLSTGPGGGLATADAGYNVTVPDGWEPTDLAAYARARRERAGLDEATVAPGPTLYTAVPQRHARRASLDGVEAVVTAGLSNPVALPASAAADAAASPPADGRSGGAGPSRRSPGDDPPRPGTVNVLVGTDRALAPGALADLLAGAVEAKAAVLLGRTAFAGTTTDAVAAACDPAGERAAFAGSGTPVGRRARICVADAIGASLDAYYADRNPPASVADATHGVVVSGRADVSRL